MADPPKELGGRGQPPEEDGERPTVAPPFDPAEFARGTMKQASGRPPPAAETGRPPADTVTDARELEHARLESLQSNPALDLVNDMVPSGVPDDREERVTSLPASETKGTPTEPEATVRGAAKPSPQALAMEMRERYDLGDFTGAREVALELMQQEPQNADARTMEEQCRVVLERMFTSKLGAFTRIPVLNVPKEQLRWLGLDHRAGFLLSHVDGMSDIDMLLDVSGMPRFEALRILASLLDQQVVSLKGA